ncbi:TPA: hypothetical protein DF272_00580 [Candidatus Falkowbacteria bacterium]|nr:hypothetical protein [Candidatus Falkowbacteria bacterium]
MTIEPIIDNPTQPSQRIKRIVYCLLGICWILTLATIIFVILELKALALGSALAVLAVAVIMELYMRINKVGEIYLQFGRKQKLKPDGDEEQTKPDC